jgi:hypothetical protein
VSCGSDAFRDAAKRQSGNHVRLNLAFVEESMRLDGNAFKLNAKGFGATVVCHDCSCFCCLSCVVVCDR